MCAKPHALQANPYRFLPLEAVYFGTVYQWIAEQAKCFVVGWRLFLFHHDVQGYHTLPWWLRLQVNALAARRGLASLDCWVGALWVLALALLLEIGVYEFELIGWRRDLLRSTVMLWALPRVSLARNRLICAVLAQRNPGWR